MKSTTEQRKAEFKTLMLENGFIPNGEATCDGREIYNRVWSKEVEVVWYGKRQSTLEIKTDEAYGIPNIRIFKDGRLESRRDYSSPKRAVNAIREIAANAGFEF